MVEKKLTFENVHALVGHNLLVLNRRIEQSRVTQLSFQQPKNKVPYIHSMQEHIKELFYIFTDKFPTRSPIHTIQLHACHISMSHYLSVALISIINPRVTLVVLVLQCQHQMINCSLDIRLLSINHQPHTAIHTCLQKY